MTNDHRTDIRGAAESDTADVREIVRAMATGEPYRDPYTGEDRDPYDVMGETFLAVEVWAPLGDECGSHRGADLDRARVEFLLCVGGPTVSVLVDLGRDAVTYRHSWGRDAASEDCHEVDLWADDVGNAGPWAPEAGPGAPWLALARDVVDGYR